MKEANKKHKLDQNWRAVNLLKLLFLIILLGILVFSFPIIAKMFGFSDAPIFNVPPHILFWVIAILVLIVILYILWIYLFYNSFWYSLEKEGIKIHKGIITSNYVLIPYSKVRNVNVTQGLFQRFLGVSTVRIELIGYTEADIIESEISGIKNADEVAEKIMLRVK